MKQGKLLKLSFSYSETLWPWSGHLGIRFQVSKEGQNYDGIVEGEILLRVESNENFNNNQQKQQRNEILNTDLRIYVKVKIIPTPPRKQRILWDQFHNLRYPSGYFPRDNLKVKNDPLDWNADHVSQI
jgi:membrane-bound transcription factor site-1 protease